MDRSVYLEAGDTAGLERLAQYMLRCPFSVSRVVRLTEEGKVLYKSEKAGPRRFPEPGREDLAAGASRNFQVFEPLDFIAELTQHIPDKGEHLVRHYGWYSNKSRGMRAKRQEEGADAGAGCIADGEVPGSREARRRWAALIKRVFEVDPLVCPKCEGAMRVVSFIERHQSEVIEEILRHCGLWDPPGARDLPRGRDPEAAPASSPSAEPEVEPDPDYLEHLWQAGELTETP